MNIRITPLPARSLQPKTSFTDSSNRFSNSKKSLVSAAKSSLLLATPTKKTQTKNINNLLLISKKSTITEPAIADKKGLLLYQQVEKNKSFLNGAELTNRFHYKV